MWVLRLIKGVTRRYRIRNSAIDEDTLRNCLLANRGKKTTWTTKIKVWNVS